MRVNKWVCVLATATLVGAAGSAQAMFFDDFDSYADQAAFNAVWSGSAQMTLITTGSPTPVSPPNTIFQGTVAQQSYRNLGAASVQLRDIDFSFDFYDPVGAGSLARTYGMVYSRGTNPTDPWTATLNQILAIGKWNTIADSGVVKYHARIAFGWGGVNWFKLDAPTSPNRSVGWHTARIKGDGALIPTLTFYIDGQVGKVLTAPDAASGNVLINYVVMGSGLSSTHGMNYDNVRVVPEPVTIALLLGGLPLVVRRRR